MKSASVRKALGAILALTFLASLAPTPAGAEQSELEQMRREASRIESELERQGRRLSVAQEEYNYIVDERQRLEGQLEDVRAELQAKEERYAELQQRLGERARVLYMNRGIWAESILKAESVGELARRRAMAGSVLLADTDLIFETDRARAEVEQTAERVGRLRDTTLAKEEELAARRAEVEREFEAQEAILDDVEGEVAELVEEERQRELEEARRRAEEEARREAERRAARERAQQAAREAAEEVGDSASEGPSGPQSGASGSEAGSAEGSGSGESSGGSAQSGGTSQNAPSNAPPPSRPEAGRALDAARGEIGKRYCWGGTGPDCYDCSGLTQFAWRQAGVEIPRSSRQQYAALPKVPRSQIQPGDLLFFGDPIHHVGIYEGGGVMIEAPYSGENVRRRSNHRSDYHGAARP